MYIAREIENTIDRMLKQYKVVLVTGARQIGKTTMLKHALSQTHRYVTLDRVPVLEEARNDPELFFMNNKPPLIIDEVQYAQNLFQQIKYIVDQSDERGTVVLTGSQAYHLMQNVTESLAGRIAILEMGGLSQREVYNNASAEPFLPTGVEVGTASRIGGANDIWEAIHRGSLPELQNQKIDWDEYYSNYVRSYIERDVRDLITLKDETLFYNFLVAVAARTGQLFSARNIANDIGVSLKTIQNWSSILEASGTITFLRPYFDNIAKQLTKTPKVFFLDTGLVCHLTRWNSAETLKNGAMAGQIFETFAVSEIMKSYMNAGKTFRDLYFYRDKKKREIDLLIQNGGKLHPIEIKKTAAPSTEIAGSFKVLDDLSLPVGTGAVVCLASEARYLTADIITTPIDLL